MNLIKIGEIKNKQKKLYNQNDIVEPYHVFSGSLDTIKYIDITSNTNWMLIGGKYYDYQFCRNQIILWTSVIGFTNLTYVDQKIASNCFAVSKENRDLVHSEAEQEDNWSKFIFEMNKSRTNRWLKAKSYISYRLSPTDSIDLAKSTSTLSNEYMTYGIESYDVDGSDGLFDWVENTSSYSGGTGFSGKTYWSMSAQTNIMNIIKNGNY